MPNKKKNRSIIILIIAFVVLIGGIMLSIPILRFLNSYSSLTPNRQHTATQYVRLLEDESYFDVFGVRDGLVFIECSIMLENTALVEQKVTLTGFLPEDEGILLKNKKVLCVDADWITWYINEPLAIALFVASSLYFVFAVVRFVILRKKRALRDWIYAFYGFSLAAGMLLFILSEEVITNLIEFDVLKDLGASALTAVAIAGVATAFVVSGSGAASIVAEVVRKIAA